MPCKSRVSVSYSPLALLHTSPLKDDLQSQIFGGHIFPVQDTPDGEPNTGFDASLLGENSANVIILLFVGCLSREVGLDYIMSLPLLPISLRLWPFYPLCGRRFSATFQVFFRGNCFIYSCIFGVSMGEGELRNSLHCRLELFLLNFLSESVSRSVMSDSSQRHGL